MRLKDATKKHILNASIQLKVAAAALGKVVVRLYAFNMLRSRSFVENTELSWVQFIAQKESVLLHLRNLLKENHASFAVSFAASF